VTASATPDHLPAVSWFPSGASTPSVRPGNPVEIALKIHALELQHGAQAVGCGFGSDRAGDRPRDLAMVHRFRHYPTDQMAFVTGHEAEQPRRGDADIGIADR
jgi:hypothetical protein